MTSEPIFTKCECVDKYGPRPPFLYADCPCDRRDLAVRVLLLSKVADAAAAILNPARGDASWLHTVEFDDLRSALAAAGGSMSTSEDGRSTTREDQP